MNANKTTNIPVRVTEEEKEEFRQVCEELYSTPSAEIYKFIKAKIKQHKGSKILANNLRRKA
jgi:antitoxin component of RelBE/YafQ-DinJ toxin-antitoxin module